MFKPRSGPRAARGVAGIVAILATACVIDRIHGPKHRASASSATRAERRTRDREPTARHRGAHRCRGPRSQRRPIIRWFVGLGAGGQPQQITAQTDFVTKFNNDPANKDKAYISLEIYDNKVAGNILKTQIASGNSPDIIGPVGVEGLNLFADQLVDLQPLIDSTGFDMTKSPGPRRLLQDRQGRHDDRRPVRRPTRHTSGTTRSCSTRRRSRIRRPRSARRTRASRGTWPPFRDTAA